MSFTKCVSAVFAFVLLMLAVSAVRAATTTYTFDPLFFNYPPASSGFSTGGGMFELEPTYGVGTTYASWNTASTATTALANMQSSMTTSNTGGIGAFSVYLPTSGTAAQGLAVEAWGQNLIGSTSASSSILGGTAPAGWADVLSSELDSDNSTIYRITYYTETPADYIRPNNNLGTFTLSLTNVSPPMGTPVLYFNGSNNGNPFDPATYPAIVYAGAGTSTGFDATLAVSPVPEPGSMALCAAGIGCALAVGYRRCRNAKRGS